MRKRDISDQVAFLGERVLQLDGTVVSAFRRIAELERKVAALESKAADLETVARGHAEALHELVVLAAPTPAQTSEQAPAHRCPNPLCLDCDQPPRPFLAPPQAVAVPACPSSGTGDAIPGWQATSAQTSRGREYIADAPHAGMVTVVEDAPPLSTRYRSGCECGGLKHCAGHPPGTGVESR